MRLRGDKSKMNDKERLEDIKNNLNILYDLFGESWALIPEENAKWLIKQVELAIQMGGE
jgi:hypothetical protein